MTHKMSFKKVYVSQQHGVKIPKSSELYANITKSNKENCYDGASVPVNALNGQHYRVNLTLFKVKTKSISLIP